jgi:hypothetical protein
MLAAPPTIAAKWRANSFIALAKGKDVKASESIINAQVEKIIKDDLLKLFNNLLGQERNITLTEQQQDRLKEIVVSAWEWTYVLKGDVVTLGDFQPTFYERGSPFVPTNMQEFEPNKKRKSAPEVAICTIGLGLLCFHSKTMGDSSEPLVVCKATVVTEPLYAS